MKKTYQVQKMHCASCAALIESDLEDAGINAQCSYAKQTLEVADHKEADEVKIRKIVQDAGYDLA